MALERMYCRACSGTGQNPYDRDCHECHRLLPHGKKGQPCIECNGKGWVYEANFGRQ